MDIQKNASKLIEAENNGIAIAPFTSSAGTITVDEAYQIQLEIVRHKMEHGAKIIGKKIGLTSKAMQEMLNVNQPDYGHLFDNMIYKNGTTISTDSFIEPRIEFEIAFVLKKDIKGPGVTIEDVKEATDYVVPAFEIIDSRIKDWKIKFEDTVADNGSSAGVILGDEFTDISEVDLAKVEMTVYRNEEYLDSATGEAVMGNPLEAVAWLANAVGDYDITLHAGEVILAGALSKAIPIENGDTFKADFSIGTVSASFNREG
ncbi:2-keto-4-pentenoate hydratase [Aquibacillus saliphilus]|uniref:2-keto-4-pentenoate hydratase n=1 Tax=Aquibacillus saliphilus TaxID=1909422 RepID=UPI001CF09133|nr:fumarylacetoacetate hydrolase family protein [Aquibacillus saliphilus]